MPWDISNPKCGPFNRPSIFTHNLQSGQIESDPTDYWDWLEECSIDTAEDINDPPVDPMPPCEPSRYWENGVWWCVSCTPDGPVVQRCKTKGNWEPDDKTRVTSVILGFDGPLIEIRSGQGSGAVVKPWKSKDERPTYRELIAALQAEEPLDNSNPHEVSAESLTEWVQKANPR